jgi:small subunit ribosomal protein S2
LTLKIEKLMLDRQKLKLEVNLCGIKNMGGSPDLVFIIDTNKEALALAEAKKLRIPIMAIVDSNCDPEEITYPIPGNDDSAKSIKLYCRLISDAIIEGIRENMVASGIDVSKLQSESIPEKLKELKALENSSEKANKKPDRSEERRVGKMYA